MKTPLAWLQLSREKIKLLVAIAGIGFADILMFIQLGFQGALFGANLRLPRSLKGDIVLMSTQSEAIFTLNSFSRRSLYQTLAMKDVASVSPVYINMATWKNPVEGNKRQMMVIGFNPQESILNVPGLDRKNRRQVQLTDVVLFDDKSRAEFGAIAEIYQQRERVTTEINTHRIKVGGLFSLGSSFTADGSVITSDLNFWRLFPERSTSLIDIGLITLKPGANIDRAIVELQKKLPENIKVLSKEEFIKAERNYWQESTAIGFIFAFGTIIGFIVGTVIVYQILYTDVVAHLPEYATLKAMGYSDRYFVVVILQEAVILAIFGYIPSFVITSALYMLAAGGTGLPIAMTVGRAIFVFLLTIIMSCISGSIALRKLSDADPADIY
jgi:putative ABC transport system permease protein